MPSTSTGEVGSASAPVEASAATSSAVKTTTTTTAAATMPSALSKRRIRGNSYYHDCKE
jgi:hypothetical protein